MKRKVKMKIEKIHYLAEEVRRRASVEEWQDEGLSYLSDEELAQMNPYSESFPDYDQCDYSWAEDDDILLSVHEINEEIVGITSEIDILERKQVRIISYQERYELGLEIKELKIQIYKLRKELNDLLNGKDANRCRRIY